MRIASSSAKIDFSGLRVLVLSPSPTAPLSHGNRKRIHRVCKDIVEAGGKLTFALYASELEWRDYIPEADLRQMESDWGRIHIIPPSRALHSAPEHGDHHWIDEWWDPIIETHLNQLFRSYTFDVVIVNYTWLSKALDFVPAGVIKVLDTHDVFSGRRELLGRHGIKPEFFYLYGPEEEKKALDRADIVWAIKEEEAEFFRKYSQRIVRTMPYMEPLTDVLPPKPLGEDKVLRVGVIGANNNVNKVNLADFLKVFRRDVEQYFAPIELIVAGSICDAFRQEDDRIVQFLGRVETVEGFYASIDAAVIPMNFSTGLKIKAGEALGYGVATVSTAHAFEGYEVHHTMQSLRDIKAVSRALIQLSFEPERLQRLRQAARRSAQTTRQAALDTLAHLAEMARARCGFAILTDCEALADKTNRGGALNDLRNWLLGYGQCELFVAGGKLKITPDLAQKISVNARLCIDPKVDISGLSPLACVNLQRITLEEFLARHAPRAIVVDTALDGEQAKALQEAEATLVVVRVAQILSAKAAKGRDLEAALSGAKAKLYLAPLPSDDIRSKVAAAGGTLVNMASLRHYGYPPRPTPKLWGKPQMMILADGAAPAARAIAKVLSEDGWKVLIANSDEATPLPPEPSARIGQTREAPMSWVADLLYDTPDLPKVVLDLSRDCGARQYIREHLTRRKVPVFTISPLRASQRLGSESPLLANGPLHAVRLMQRVAYGDPALLSQLKGKETILETRAWEEGWSSIAPILEDLRRGRAAGFESELGFEL